MPQILLTMTARGVSGLEEECHGCKRKLRRGERMSGVRYNDGTPAGWHCDGCMDVWKTKGEEFLPRWEEESVVPVQT